MDKTGMDDAETEGPPVVSANAARQLRATVRVQPEAAPANIGIIAGAAVTASLIKVEQASGAAIETTQLPPRREDSDASPALAEARVTAIASEAGPTQATPPQTASLPIPPPPDAAAPNSQSEPTPAATILPPPAIPPDALLAEAGSAPPATSLPLPPARSDASEAPPPPNSRITTRAASGTEDDPLRLDITLLDAPESARILISGLPPGAALSAGMAQPDGSWLVGKADLAGLRLIPTPDWSGDAMLSLRLHTDRCGRVPGAEHRRRRRCAATRPPGGERW
jgi:hypothetical protein